MRALLSSPYIYGRMYNAQCTISIITKTDVIWIELPILACNNSTTLPVRVECRYTSRVQVPYKIHAPQEPAGALKNNKILHGQLYSYSYVYEKHICTSRTQPRPHSLNVGSLVWWALERFSPSAGIKSAPLNVALLPCLVAANGWWAWMATSCTACSQI